MKYVIGLDLGTSSVGWSAIETDPEGNLVDIIALGSRHFNEVAESDGKKLKNEARRNARGARRNISRRKMRKQSVLRLLVQIKLIGNASNPFSTSESPHAPYELRSRALNEELSTLELARAIYHLAQRRGFKSNRGAKLASLFEEPELQDLFENDLESVDEGMSDEANEDEGVVLKAISSLKSELGSQTIGQFFLNELQSGRKVRRRYTLRSMYEAEFDAIFDAQKQYHPCLSDQVRASLRYALFYQRPLKGQSHRVGKCSLEPTKTKAAKSTLVAQRFRIWSDLANLTILDRDTGEMRNLTLDEKYRLAEKLECQRSISWAKLATELGFKSRKSLTFNLEKAYKDGLRGNLTSARMHKIAPDFWGELDGESQRELVEIISTSGDRGQLYKTLKAKYQLPVRQAYDLATVEFEPGYASLSHRAMDAMLSKMKGGMSRTEAQIACGYSPWSEEVPKLDKIAAPPNMAEITSPRVRKTLNQARKVVNALVHKYGRPTTIRIEMAREMSLNRKEKAEWEKAKKRGEKENDEARAALASMGIANPDRKAVIWYRLAKQVEWKCPYSGKTIPQSPAAMSEFQIEHIIPYEISFDSSFNNLTLCHEQYNKRKGKQTPYQAFGGTADWPAMVERIDKITGLGSGRKKALFKSEQEPDTDKMIERQLNETKWIARAAAQFLRPLTDDIECTRGAATAMLREHWGLMQPLYGNNAKSRDDLRQHAIDAVAIACTSRSLFQKISRERKPTGQTIVPLSSERVPPAPAWLVPKLKAILPQVVVSHETTRQILGAFHEESVYGKRKSGEYHLRRQLNKLKVSEVDQIVDPNLKGVVKSRIAEAIASGKGAKIDQIFAGGVPYCNSVAHRARIYARIKDAKVLESPSINPTKYMQLGNNHHVAIWEHPATGKRIGVFVTMLDAARAVRNKHQESPVSMVSPKPGYEFVMWLAANDTVEYKGTFYRVQKIDPTGDRLVLRMVIAATVQDNKQRLIKSINVLRCEKVEVDVLGQVRLYPRGKL